MNDKIELLRIILAWCNEVVIGAATLYSDPRFEGLDDDMGRILRHLSKIEASATALNEVAIYRISDFVTAESVVSSAAPKGVISRRKRRAQHSDKEIVRQQAHERIRGLSRMGHTNLEDDITGAIYDEGLDPSYPHAYRVTRVLRQKWPDIVKDALRQT